MSKSWIAALRESRIGWLVRLAAFGLYAVAAAFFTIVGGMIWRGDVWSFLIYAERPYSHLAGGFVFLGAAYYLHVGYRNDARAWKRLMAKAVLALFGVGMAALIGEIGIRLILIKQQASGSLSQLRDERAMERVLKSDNPHPMAAIIDISDHLDLVFELRPGLNTEFGHRILRTNKHGMRADVDYAL